MLGLYPIGSRAISSGPFSLTAIPEQMSAAPSFAFGITARAGAIVPLSASLALSFAVNGNWIVHQALSATLSISFDGSPRLFVAGKPIILSAVPQSYTLRASQVSYTLKALPESFTIRGQA